jgi:lysophosphatidic acid acyltransferase/lysophosphatidylinositol acyltransferase
MAIPLVLVVLPLGLLFLLSGLIVNTIQVARLRPHQGR